MGQSYRQSRDKRVDLQATARIIPALDGSEGRGDAYSSCFQNEADARRGS